MQISYRKYLILCFCLYCFQFTLSAQTPSLSWLIAGGSVSKSDKVVDIVVDSNISVIAAGKFNDIVDFDPGIDTFNLTASTSGDIFIAKYTSNKKFVWAKSISPNGDLDVFKSDSAGNIYLVGIFQQTVDFDPGPGVYNVSSNGNSSTFILKLDKDGNFLWVKTFTARAGIGNTLAIDKDKNILVGGAFMGTVDFDPGSNIFNMTSAPGLPDMFVLKLDILGNFLWAKQIISIDGSQHQQFGLETDQFNNIFFAGNFTNSIDCDPGPATVTITSNGNIDAFILKLNASGTYQWVKQFGGPNTEKIFGLTIDKQGNIFSTGQFAGTVDFDPGISIFQLTSPSLRRCAFISKLDNAGNFIYAKNFQSGESFGQALAIDSSNSLYISGGFHYTVDFDPGPSIYDLSPGELFIVKLSQSGDFEWAVRFNSTDSNYFESIYSSLKIDPSNNIYFAGSFTSTVDFDPGIDSFLIASNADWDMFLLKLGAKPCDNTTKNIIQAVSCNSYVLNGVTYNRTGQFYQILKNTAGCDSILQLNLTISSLQTNLVQTSCGPISWQGRILNQSGLYRDTIGLTNGCDSILILNLTVSEKPTLNLGKDTVLCTGDTIHLFAGSFNSYQWNTGSNSSSISITQQGVYSVRVVSDNGCSAMDSLIVTPSTTCIPCTDPKIVEKIYPTPFNDILTVRIKPSICELNMDIYNVLGQLLVKGKKIQTGVNHIIMSRFPSGAYFYRIYYENIKIAEGKLLKH